MVEETFEPGMTVNLVARRHGVAPQSPVHVTPAGGAGLVDGRWQRRKGRCGLGVSNSAEPGSRTASAARQETLEAEILKIAFVVRALRHWLSGSRVKVNSRSPASSRLSATARCLSLHFADEGLAARLDLLTRGRIDHVVVIRGDLVVQALWRVREKVPVLVDRAALDRGVPSSEALQSALNVIEAKAHFDAPERVVHIRVAGLDDRLYLDLGDATWRAVEIDATGWRVIDNPPVGFESCRRDAASPGASDWWVIEVLRSFLQCAIG